MTIWRTIPITGVLWTPCLASTLYSINTTQWNVILYHGIPYIVPYIVWHTIPRNTIHMTIWQFYRANLLQDKLYLCSAETIFICASPLYFRLMSHQLQWWLLKCKKLEVVNKHWSQSLLLFTGIRASPQYWISCLKTFPLYDETLYFASPIPHWDATVTRCKLRQKSIVLMSMLDAGHTVSDTVSKNKWPWESNLANSEKISTSCFPGFFFLSCLSSRS